MQKDTCQGYRLSPQQERLWSLQQTDSAQPYSAQCAILIEGPLNREALSGAVQSIVNRHEILRTSLYHLPRMPMPMQVIAEKATPSFQECDLLGFDQEEQWGMVQSLAREASQMPFKLEQDSNIHLTLATLSPGKYILIASLPAWCADQVTLKNFLLEISRAYASCLKDEVLSDAPVQYADAAEVLNELLESQDTEAGREYWRKQDLSAAHTFKLSFEDQVAGKQNFQPSSFSLKIDDGTSSKIEAMAGKHETPISTFFLACWQILLWRLTGRDDLIVGNSNSGRSYEGLEDALGLFARYLPVRVEMQKNSRFSSVLRRVNESVRESNDWGDYFTWKNVDNSPNDFNETVFFPFTFEFEERPPKQAVNGVLFSIYQQHSYIDRFKIKLMAIRSAESLQVEFHYDSLSFRSEDINRLAQQFQLLLAEVANNMERAVGEIDFVTDVEREQLLVEWNDTDVNYPEDQCAFEQFEAQVEQIPEYVAVTFQGEQLSYRALNERANQLGHYLQRCGVGPEVRVGVYVQRSLDMVVGVLGALKAGGAYVPLDPTYPPERLGFMMEDAGLRVVLTQASLREKLPPTTATIVTLDADWEAIAREGKDNPISHVAPQNLAYIIYTSGSTGRPKGVMVTHQGLQNYLCWAKSAYRVADGKGSLVHSSLGFDLSVTSLYLPLLVGQPVHLVAEEPGVEALAEALSETDHYSLVKITPAHLELLAQQLSERTVAGCTNALVIGGEALLAENLAFWRQHSPQTRLINEYGPTETVVGCCVYEVTAQSAESGAVPIGRPIANTKLYVLDEQLRLVPLGAIGELYIGGDGVARGYLGRPQLTAERFVPDPFSGEAGARLYKTGDLTRYMQDGNLEFIGRIDDQVKVRGYRVELGEIETALSMLPRVREAVVLACDEPASGHKRLVAYVVAPEETGTAIQNEWRNCLAARLPEYMIPSAFVLLDEMPLTANGKVDRRALPPPEEQHSQTFIAPRTPVEEVLAGIWSQVLGRQLIGISDNFFQLGGHSLLATQVISRARDTFQVGLSARHLFETPTVEGLAAKIEELMQDTDALVIPPIVPVSRDRELPLSSPQLRLWFIQQLDVTSFAYNIPMAVSLTGELNKEALERTLSEVVRRHEILRTTFPMIDGRSVQVINPAAPVHLEEIDISTLPEEEREAEALRLLARDSERPFDLARDQMLRTCLLKLSEEQHILLATVHHIVSDGWSMAVLTNEVMELYEAFMSGREPRLRELPFQYADYAVWQQEWLKGEVLERQLAYWRQQLTDAPMLTLPTDRPRPALLSGKGSYLQFTIPDDLTKRLRELNRQAGVTMFMTLLAAFQVLLARYSGQDDIVVGSLIAGRNRADMEALIGFFVNTLVLRTDLSGDPSFNDLLGRVREVSLGAYSNQDLPLDRLVEELQPQRELNRNPLFQVVFVLQNAPVADSHLPGLSLGALEVETGTAKTDISLSMMERGDAISGSLEYSTDLFDRSTIERFIEHFVILLEGVVAHPEQRISQLPLLSETERRQILINCNAATSPVPISDCLHQLLEKQVERTPEQVAVVFEDEQLTYQQLNSRANQLAHYLQSLGVGPEVKVGLCMERSLNMVVSVVGILKAGAAYVPLDLSYPPARLSFMLDDADVRVLLTEQNLLSALPESGARALCLDTDRELLDQQPISNPSSPVNADNLAYVIYTSGSTGTPKGTLVTHRNVTRLFAVTELQFGFNEQDVWTLFHSIAFDFSVWELWGALLYGGKLVVVPYFVSRSPEALYQLLLDHQVTVLNQTPSAFYQLMEVVIEAEETGGSDGKLALRDIIFGGEALDVARLEQWMSRYGDEQPALINMYGITETTVHVTYRRLTRQDVVAPRGSIIGKGLADLQVYVLGQGMELVPTGVAGELYVGGEGVARGYLGRAELTAERFVPNPYDGVAGTRLYKTGDLARYRKDGELEYLGRVDQQVKLRGYRIELGEIETQILSQPDVKQSVVALREDVAGDKRLVAYVVPAREGGSIDLSGLRERVRQTLPEHMVPSAFVVLEELPLTAHGKIDLRALPAPEQERSQLDQTFVAPRDVIELQLAQIWENLLNIQPVGVTDNFFEIGGHSILAVQLMSQIKNQMGTELPLTSLFPDATIENLARTLRNAGNNNWSPLVGLQPEGTKTPFFCVHPVIGSSFCLYPLARYIGSDQPFYGFQAPGLDSERDPFTDPKEMAAHYVEAMRKIQPQGPYLLGGYSLGGTIAFEMAQQLQAEGQRVDVLALLDAMVIHDEGFAEALETQGEDDEADLIANFLEESCPVSADYLRELGPEEMLTYALDQAKRAALLPPDFEVAQLRRLLKVHRANLHAWAIDYVPQFFPGRIILFRATEEERTDLTLGWGRLAGEGVEIHDVPGRHVSMIKEPHVKTLAERLRAVLDGAANGISTATNNESNDRPRAFESTAYAARSNPDLF